MSMENEVETKLEQEQLPEPSKKAQRVTVELNARGLPVPQDLEGAYRVAELWLRGGALPKWIKNATQALAAAQFCRSLGLEPLSALPHICEINGRFSLWGEGPLAVARNSGKLEWIKEFFIDSDYKEINFTNKNLSADIYAAICIVKRVGHEPREFFFTREDEQTANKGLAVVWNGYKKIMYKRKARAIAIKDEFGDCLVGAGISEYDYETAPDVDPTLSEPTLAEKLNKKYLLGDAKNEVHVDGDLPADKA